MSFQALRHEYATRVIGPLILDEVDGTVAKIVRRYDPVVYAGAATWRDAQEDLVQEVIARVLLQEHQLDYIMQTAHSLKDFRALLHRQVERQLARRRQRTVVDNLLGRCREILDDASLFTKVRRGRRSYYRLVSTPVEERSPTLAELRSAANSAATVPRILPRRGDRAPLVYSTLNLTALLRIVGASVPTWFGVNDLDQILGDVLTGWIPSFLDNSEVVFDEAALTLSPEEELIAKSVTEDVFGALSPEQRLILVRKIEGIADGALADELGVSRPTAAGRKDTALAVIENEIRQLPSNIQAEIIDRVVVMCALEVIGA